MNEKNGSKKSQNAGEAAKLSLSARVRKFSSVTGRREVLGFADLVIGGAFVIKDITIVRAKAEGSETYGEPFVCFPQKKGTGENASKYYDTCHPITPEAQKQASEVILKAHKEVMAAAA